MSGARGKLAHELRELIPVTLFFLVAFTLLALTQTLLLAEHGLHATTFAAAAIGALLVAKVVVIADHLPFINRFPDRPLIYNALWKAGIYFVASFALRYIEHLIRFWREAGGFTQANHRMLDEIIWPHFWCVQLWLLVLLLVYCAARELIGAIGSDRIVGPFFRPPTPAAPPATPAGQAAQPERRAQ